MIEADSSSVVERQLCRARAGFAEHAAVFEAVSARLMARLEYLAIEPRVVLDLGCRNGYQLSSLREQYPHATLLGMDVTVGRSSTAAAGRERVGFLAGLLGQRRWQLPGLPRSGSAAATHLLAGQATAVPLQDASVDLVICNLLLPWCAQPDRVLREIVRVLAPGGAVLLTTAGPDTLQEYRALWAALDGHLHVFGLTDMHDIGDAMLGAGFAAPVLDRENLIIDYPTIDALEQELRHVGAANLARGRRRGLMAPSVRNDLRRLSAEKGRFPVTLELVQGHAWKGELAATVQTEGQQTADGFAISFDSLRRSLKR